MQGFHRGRNITGSGDTIVVSRDASVSVEGSERETPARLISKTSGTVVIDLSEAVPRSEIFRTQSMGKDGGRSTGGKMVMQFVLDRNLPQ